MSEHVTLIIKDSEKVKVSSQISRLSELIKSIIEDSPNDEIPLEQISKPVLDQILVYCEKSGYSNQNHVLNYISVPGGSFEVWQREFLANQDSQMIKMLISAADYLQMKALLNLLLAHLALLLRNQPIEELCRMYEVEEPLTDEMEEEMLKDYPWVYSINYFK